MKKKLSVVEWAVRNHGVVILITCCLIAFGIFGLAKMNKNEFPDFTIRQAIVVAACPGVNVSDVEEQVTKPLEDFIFSYKEVRKDKTKSFSRHGLSIIQVELNADYSDNDVFWSKFRHGLSTFKAQLPQNVLALQVNDDYAETSSMLLTIESNDKTYRELKKYADNLQESLRQVEQVGRMKLLGMQKEQISVYIDNARLSQYGISEESLAVSLFAKGFVTTAGTLHGAAYNSPVYVSRSINIENDVENTIVYSSPSGVNVRLRDIAAVKREYAEPSSEIENNGVKCLLLSIEMKKGRNITDMGGGINKVLDKFSRDLPRDVSLFKITDQTKVVSDSVTNFLKELVIAIVAVMIVVLLLLPLRVALVASSTIPITIFISLGLFYAFKIELNTVTLAALIVTLGMIVDNAIVIIDSYVETLREGRPRVEAAVGSARHFFKSILVATLAISITFFPFLLTLEGTFRDFITAFPWAITIVLAVSLLVAELVVPFLLCFFIRKPAGNSAGNGNGGRKFVFEDWLQEKYNRLITLCFAHPQRTIAAGAASIIIAALLIPFLPLRLMPVAERNQFAVELYLPTGTALKKTSAVADSLESILKKDPRVVSIASFKGMATPRFQTG